MPERGTGPEEAAASFAVPAVPPFSLEATVRVLQRRPMNRVNRWEDGRYLRVLPTAEGLRLIAVENRGAGDAPDLHGLVFGGSISPRTRDQLAAMVQRLLGTAVDIAPFYHAARSEPRLRAAVESLRGLKPPRFLTLFETIANVIPFQQISLAAGDAVVGRLVDRFGDHFRLGDRIYHAFPPPERIAACDAAELRDLGLSRTKAATLRDTARRILAGELSEERLEVLPSAAAMDSLMALSGIGPWSAGLILLRGLRRMEIFPDGDVGAAKNLGRLLGVEGSARDGAQQALLARMGEARGYLYFYALGWRLIQEGLITPVPGGA
ncbi:MAG: DNA-3-methyladenine glycosylase 2 [Chloroflexota bacterium]